MRRFFGQLRMREKSKYSQAIVDRHQDDSVVNQCAIFIQGARSGAACIGPAMDPEHYGKFFLYRPVRCNDVQEKAIFLAHFGVASVPVSRGYLGARSAKSVGRRAPLAMPLTEPVAASEDLPAEVARKGSPKNPPARQSLAFHAAGPRWFLLQAQSQPNRPCDWSQAARTYSGRPLMAQ